MKKTTPPLNLITKAIKNGSIAELVSMFGNEDAIKGYMSPLGGVLHLAADSGNIKLVKDLIALGVDQNARSGIEDSAPIDVAATEGHADIVDFLIKNGAIIDVSDPARNPLFGAILSQNIEIAAMLLHAGIDYLIEYTGDSMNKMNAEKFAIERGCVDIAALIRSYRESKKPPMKFR